MKAEIKKAYQLPGYVYIGPQTPDLRFDPVRRREVVCDAAMRTMRSTFTPTPYPPTLPPHTSNGGAQPPLPTPHTRKNGAAYGGAYLPTPRVARGKVCRWPYPWKRKATQVAHGRVSSGRNR